MMMPDAITILHISDMQFGKFHRFANKNGTPPNPHDTLTARLIDDLHLLSEQHKLTPDLIICTGDLAEWGLPKEFADAFAFLAKLCEHYALPRSRCVVIPGNHDINRFSCSAYFDECKSNGEEPVIPWFPKWKQYKAAFDSFYAGLADIRFEPMEPWTLFVNEDLCVVVAGLNSTMDEGHDAAVNSETREDKGHHGLCEERQYQWFKQRLSEPQFKGWLRIGAVHHNTNRGCRSDNENLRDADLLGGILGDELHLLLHGHTHEAKADVLARSLPVYSTGSASLKTSSETASVPTDIPNQYQLLRIERGSITRYCRQYAPRNTPPAFIGDVRQSKNGGDWVIKDDADLSSVSFFTAKADAAEAEDLIEKAVRPSVLIPTPPAFYAEPDYIGSHQFVGRETQLKTLSDWAMPTNDKSLLLFEAIGGNGKSMLTWEWTTKHATMVRTGADSWAGRFWYSFYERGAIMQDFCQRALAYMTGQPLEELKKKKTAEMKDELIALLHARPWLIILDGLERVLVAYHRIDAAEVPDEEVNSPTDKVLNRNPCDAIREEDNDLLRALARCAPSKILVSSRLIPRVLLNQAGLPIPGVHLAVLPGLDEADAEKLLRACDITGSSSAIRYYLTTNCGNHPLVIGVLAGLIYDYLPDRGNFDAWSAAPDGGAALDLAKLDLVQRRNHILHAALEALPPASHQLLSTLALLSESVDYETLKAFNPHLPPEPEEVDEPTAPEEDLLWEHITKEAKAQTRKQYKAALANRKKYEKALRAWLDSSEVRAAPAKLGETVKDLERRGLLQYDGRQKRHDLHPVVRGVAAGGMNVEDRERYGQRVVDHFSSQPHSPYEQAQTMDDLSSGLQVVRTLIKLGHFQQAANAYCGDLGFALGINLEAHTEILSLLRPLFPAGWAKLPEELETWDASYLANIAAAALDQCGELQEALTAFVAALRSSLEKEDWVHTSIRLHNIFGNLSAQTRLAKAHRVDALALDLATVCEHDEELFLSRLGHFSQQTYLGQWIAAEKTWRLLDPMGRGWRRGSYNQGSAEVCFARWQFYQGTLQQEHLTAAATLAQQDNTRIVLRGLHGLRGSWRLEQHDWAGAATSFQEAVRMARERRLVDETSETGLALAKFHLGQLSGDDARNEAERLAQLRDPAHRTLALLWLAAGDHNQANHHALAAYIDAWADGEPYVFRYELTKTTELLQQMSIPVPTLPPYDPAQDEPFPWEADVRAAIEKLRAEKETD